MKKLRFSLGKKLTALIVLMGLVLSAAALAVSYRAFSSSMTDYYSQLGDSLVRTLASQLDPDELDRYYETGEMDEAYYPTQDFIRDLVENNHVEYLYVVRPHGVGVTFLFDSDMEVSGGGSYADGGYCALGTYVDLVGDFAANLDNLLNGREVEPITQRDDSFGWQMTVMTPVLHENGDVAGYVMADISMNDIMTTRQTFLLALSAILAVLMAGFIVLFLLILRRTVIRPIDLLTSATGAFIASNEEELAAGTARVNVPEIRTGDEVEQLADAFRKMEADMLDYIRSFMQITAEKERIGAELSVATRIQGSMLPCIFPPFPERTEFDIYATMTPAKEVGGDFYDFFLVDEDHLALVIADVSGKGVPAALFMVITKVLLKNSAQTGLSPKAVLEKVNEQLCSGNSIDMFVTVWLGVLQLSTGVLTCANAGHEFPALCRAGEKFELFKDPHGFVLAGMETSRYREYTLTLSHGDTLFVYTDGVAEAADPENQLFGTERMLQSLNKNAQDPPSLLLERMKADIDAFAGEAPQFDDITMLAVRYQGKGDPAWKERCFAASDEELEPVQQFVTAQLESLSCSPQSLVQLEVALEEIFVNIAHYAYPAGRSGSVTVRCAVQQDPLQVTVVFRDSGVHFNPLAKPDADITLKTEDRPIGGLGILMVKKTMDRVEYAYENGENVLTISKNLGA